MQNIEWLDKNEYPFNTHSIRIDGHLMNYIDEGYGEVVLFIHGTPGWSFEYRKVIKELQSKFRCIAPDHLGFGLSDKPENIDYTPFGHSLRLQIFIENLNLTNINLVVHDFGGPIGLSVAINHPELFKSIKIMNTWLWSLKEYDHFRKPAKIIGTVIGKLLYQNLNFSANVLLKSAFSDKSNLPKKIHDQYKVAQDKQGRRAAYQFALSLLGESDWYDQLWKNRDKLQKIKTEIIWGMEDKLLPANLLLDKWRQGFPLANFKAIDGVGHFPHEENVEAIVSTIRNSK